MTPAPCLAAISPRKSYRSSRPAVSTDIRCLRPAAASALRISQASPCFFAKRRTKAASCPYSVATQSMVQMTHNEVVPPPLRDQPVQHHHRIPPAGNGDECRRGGSSGWHDGRLTGEGVARLFKSSRTSFQLVSWCGEIPSPLPFPAPSWELGVPVNELENSSYAPISASPSLRRSRLPAYLRSAVISSSTLSIRLCICSWL